MPTIPRVYLTGNETLAELKALGLTEKGRRYQAKKHGWFCPSMRPTYPQAEGPGGFQVLANPQHFVKAIVLQEVHTTVLVIDEDTIDDWVQEALCRCWERRHAAHVTHFTSYYYAMVRGLTRQWIVRYRANHVRHIPLHACRAA